MTIREARKRADYWKKKLGLDNFKFEIKRVTSKEMAGDEYVGHAYWKPEYQEARIHLRKDANEHDLLHEIVHVRMESHLPAPREYDPLYERGINAMVDALIGYPEPGSLT